MAERLSHGLGPASLLYRALSPTLQKARIPAHGGARETRATGCAMAKPVLISVVEDDEPFRESMRKLITALGYTVEVFRSAKDFLTSPLRAATACLVSDVQMPGMSGVELQRFLVKSGELIPTILVTAYPDETTKNRALLDGVVCYLAKPVDDDQLERCIRTALEDRKPATESS